MKTVFLDPYLRGGSMNIFGAGSFSRDFGAIKRSAIQSMDLELSKKSSESF